MSEVKHTPGPWEIEYDNADSSGGGQWYNAGPAKVWFPYNVNKQEEDEALANARLIVAAPELLEALQAYEAWAHKTLCYDRELRPIRAQIRAAIAKATGAPK